MEAPAHAPVLDSSGEGIVGRNAERRLIVAFLTDPTPGAAGLVLTGDAGIGKTALWEWSNRQAAGAGYAVLCSRASLAEARLPWVALTDLLAGVPPEVLASLPAPQLHVLRSVMLQVVGGAVPDERTVGTAMWTVLRTMAASTPVVLAIDDLPYVDIASAAAVRFALRRMEPPARVRLVATTRDEARPSSPVDGLPADRVSRVGVGPLSVGATFELLATRLSVRLARPVLLRVHDTAAGNPLYALELARALQRLEIRLAPGVPLPVPTGLAALVADRVSNVAPEVLELAAGTAAAWRFTDVDVDPVALGQAVDAGLVIVDQPVTGAGSRVVRSVHPLLGAAAYAALSPSARHALHQRLADRTEDPVERARHVALAGNGSARATAGVLDQGVAAALAAGIPHVAVDLSRLALERTESDPDWAQRSDTLADALFRTGDTEGALETQRAAVARTPPGPIRARRRIRLAEIMVEVTGEDLAAAELLAALDDAGDGPGVRAEVLLTLAAVTVDVVQIDEWSAEAVALLDQVDRPDPVVVSGALAQAAGAQFRAGRGLDHDAFRRAIDLEQHHPGRRLSDRADASYAALLKYADDLDGAEVRLTALLDEARGSGDLSSIAYVLSHLPQISLWRGDFGAAQLLAEEYLTVADEGSLALHQTQARYNLGIVLAHRGRLGEAEPLLVSTYDGDTATDWDRQRGQGALGFVALSRGDTAAAARYLELWHDLLAGMHFGEPGYSRSYLDYLSALVGQGRLVDAENVLQRLRGQVRRSGRGSAGAVALVGSALIDAAQGRLAAAQDAAGRATAWYDGSPFRVDRARALLIAGRIHRRAKAKGLARDALVEAHREFATIGAVAWAEQAAAELARVNLRPGAPMSLTETERRVATLAATGLTNQEVAHQLFLAVKTVEANLARAYRKLGIRSRAELGRRLDDTP